MLVGKNHYLPTGDWAPALSTQRLQKSVSPTETPKGEEKVDGEGLKCSWRKSRTGSLPDAEWGVGRNWRLMVLARQGGSFPNSGGSLKKFSGNLVLWGI